MRSDLDNPSVTGIYQGVIAKYRSARPSVTVAVVRLGLATDRRPRGEAEFPHGTPLDWRASHDRERHLPLLHRRNARQRWYGSGGAAGGDRGGELSE
jgi:hypothetical protein